MLERFNALKKWPLHRQWLSERLDVMAGGIAIGGVCFAGAILAIAVLFKSEWDSPQTNDLVSASVGSDLGFANVSPDSTVQLNEPRLEDAFAGTIDVKPKWSASEVEQRSKQRADCHRIAYAIEDASKRRTQLLTEQIGKVEADLNTLRNNANIETFVESMTNGDAAWNRVFDSNGLRRTVSTRFEDYLFSELETRNLLEAHAREFQIALARIDDAALIEMEIDSDLDSQRLSRPVIQLKLLSQSTQRAVRELREKVIEVADQQIMSTAGSAAVGFSVEEIARQQMAFDAQGNYNVFGDIGAAILGFAAGKLTDDIAAEFMDVKGQLRSTINSGLYAIYSDLTSEDSNRAEWRACLSEIKSLHDTAFLESVMTSMGADRELLQKYLK